MNPEILQPLRESLSLFLSGFEGDGSCLYLDAIATGVRRLCSQFVQDGHVRGFEIELNGVNASHPVANWPIAALELSGIVLLVRTPIGNIVIDETEFPKRAQVDESQRQEEFQSEFNESVALEDWVHIRDGAQ